ncbi:multidrug transporter MatE [Peribacillus butanolivorans]|uniref:Multidrug export protein MepA n=1 Tax=Peribacillus butanolivorans TaxID=421767 RepID=A0AAX0RUF3_9BACI|nr:MATE family efflux transporter [Peribacillus butanolivorans]AXN40829.1 MATE family efflux transporter [Peribacillus butanolivorans]PEJ23528.1 multidrug transporter MatE [Peribacillus butanolivorans]
METIDVQDQSNIDPKVLGNRELGTKNLSSLFYRYITFAILGNVFLLIPSFIDGNILGQLGPEKMAGVGIGITILVLSRAIGTFIGVGTGAVAALRLGAGKVEEARSIAGQSIWFGVILSTVIGILGYINNESIMRFFGANDTTLPFAMQFGEYIWIAFPFQVLALILGILTILDERPALSMISWLGGGILAAIIELILFHTFHFGVAASAWAGSIGPAVPSLLIFYFIFSESLLKPKLKDIRIKLNTLKEVSATGFPSFSIQITMFISIIFINNLLVSLGGELHVSAFTIQNAYITNFLMFVVIGITTGIQPLISYNYGAKLYERVNKITSLGMKFTFIISLFLTLLIYFFTDSIVNFFTGGDPAFQNLGVWSTRVFNVTFPLAAIVLFISCYFQSIEQTTKATFIAIGRSFLFLIPLFYILPKFFGVNGVWYSIPVADILAFSIAIYFMYREFLRLNQLKQIEYKDTKEVSN